MLLTGTNGIGKTRLLGHWRDQLDTLLSHPIDLIITASQGLPSTALQIARATWIAASQSKASIINATHIQSTPTQYRPASNNATSTSGVSPVTI